jgi:hypothetical protein
MLDCERRPWRLPGAAIRRLAFLPNGKRAHGAQLAALVCTDDRYLKAQGVPLADVKGCVPVDGNHHDLPAIIETVETP